MNEHSRNIQVARESILQELRRRFLEDRGCGVTAPSDISKIISGRYFRNFDAEVKA